MNIIGVVAHTLGYGDASAVLTSGGQVVGLVEEERFSRRRYDDGFPTRSIQWLLERAQLKGDAIDLVVLHIHPWRGMANRVWWLLRNAVDTFSNIQEYWSCYRAYGGLREEIAKALGSRRFRMEHYDHHECHAAMAFYTSRYDRAAVLTLDGTGEGTTGTVWRASRSRGLERLARLPYPHSPGFVYSAICDHIGFPPPAGPGKVMGLSAYGDPKRFLPLMERIIRFERDRFRLDLDYLLYHRNLATPLSSKPWLSERFTRETGVPRRSRTDELQQVHMDLAAALQERFNQIGVSMARWALRLTGESNLCLGGGVALNSVMNGVIFESECAASVHVQPAPGDGGNGMGATYLALLKRGLELPEFRSIPFTGPDYTRDEMLASLMRHGLEARETDDAPGDAAAGLKAGQIIGWFQGNMEFGPRALGNRSILANPTIPGIKDTINQRVKHREWFRPFAPSVCREDLAHFFTGPADNPYMLIVARVRDEWKSRLSGITHVDGTARVQSVAREENPRFHALIKRFGQLTGIPVVLNTSFNDQEPIVCSPDDAIRCFLSTEMDRLYLGDLVVSK